MRKLRAAIFAGWFYGVTFAFCVAGLVVRLIFPRRAMGFAKAWVAVVMAGMGPICGMRLVVTGLEHLPRDGPALLASEHQSEFDTLVWMHLVARPCYVMKQELSRLPLFGPLLLLAGMIPVDRKAGARALRGLLVEAAVAAGAGRQIVIFPQGTRTPPGARVVLQAGVAAVAGRLGLPVIPVATDSGVCWKPGVLDRVGGAIHVAIGPPIPAGTPRVALLAAIERFWDEQARTGYQTGYRAVDEPVDEPGEVAPARWSRHG